MGDFVLNQMYAMEALFTFSIAALHLRRGEYSMRLSQNMYKSVGKMERRNKEV